MIQPVLESELTLLERTFSVQRSSAFHIWFAKLAIDLDDDDAYDALSVEGPNDKGMDLFWIDHSNQRVFIAQCKYASAYDHKPKVGEVNALIECLDWLSTPETLLSEGRPELISAADDYREAVKRDYSVQLWFVYCGKSDANVDKRIRAFNENQENIDNNRSVVHCHLSLLESMFEEVRSGGQRIEKAEFIVAKGSLEVTGTFGKGLVTTIAGNDLVTLYEDFGDILFARNIRGWLGARKGSVNAAIIDTLKNDRERSNFWAYNNGITIVCDDFSYDTKSGKLQLTNFSIVNGCQTTVALAKSNGNDLPADIALLARIVSPPESIIDSVIRFTNSQNLIRKWDLVSQDITQKRLKNEFASLNNPHFYAVRRGEWAALSADDKRKFKPNGSYRTVKHDLLAQFLASFKGFPVNAYKEKGLLFESLYSRTFPPDLRVEEALLVWKIGEVVRELVREEIRTETEKVSDGDKSREKYVLMLRRGGRFYTVAVLGLVAKLRNGPDFLRSIDEERIMSKGAIDRFSKYAKVSIPWYKSAVSDLIELSGTDISVLIRESDFFERVSERIENQYEVYSVNEDWLKGALPKLF